MGGHDPRSPLTDLPGGQINPSRDSVRFIPPHTAFLPRRICLFLDYTKFKHNTRNDCGQLDAVVKCGYRRQRLAVRGGGDRSACDWSPAQEVVSATSPASHEPLPLAASLLCNLLSGRSPRRGEAAGLQQQQSVARCWTAGLYHLSVCAVSLVPG